MEEEIRIKIEDLVQSYPAVDAKILHHFESPLQHFEKIRVDLQKKEQALQALLKTPQAQTALNGFRQIFASIESASLTLSQSKFAEQFQSMNKVLASESVRSAIVTMARQANGIYKPHGVESFTSPAYRPSPNHHSPFEKTSNPKNSVSNKLKELNQALGLEYQGFLITFKAHLMDYLDSIEGENRTELFQLAVMQVLEDYQNQALFKHPFCTFPLKPIFHSPKYLETFPTIEAYCIPDYDYCTSKKGYKKKGRQPLYLETGIPNTVALADPYLVSFTTQRKFFVGKTEIELNKTPLAFLQLFSKSPTGIHTQDLYEIGTADTIRTLISRLNQQIKNVTGHQENIFVSSAKRYTLNNRFKWAFHPVT